MKNKSIYLLVLLVTLTVAGCETVKGVGKDISGLGNVISGGSEKVQGEIQK